MVVSSGVYLQIEPSAMSNNGELSERGLYTTFYGMILVKATLMCLLISDSAIFVELSVTFASYHVCRLFLVNFA